MAHDSGPHDVRAVLLQLVKRYGGIMQLKLAVLENFGFILVVIVAIVANDDLAAVADCPG